MGRKIKYIRVEKSFAGVSVRELEETGICEVVETEKCFIIGRKGTNRRTLERIGDS